MPIEQAIRQSKQFPTEQVRLTVSIMYSSSLLYGMTNSALKPYGISVQQFNVLRILRGSYPQALSMKTLTERMVDKMSNTSRLVDKLEQKNLILRNTDKTDKRKVEIQITDAGLYLLIEASEALENRTTEFLKERLTQEETTQAMGLLNKIIKNV